MSLAILAGGLIGFGQNLNLLLEYFYGIGQIFAVVT